MVIQQTNSQLPAFQFENFSSKHIEAAASLRATFQEHGFYSKFGKPFWCLFFKGLVESADSIAIVAINSTNGSLAGYVIGTSNIKRMHDQILEGRRIAFAFACIRGLARHPSLVVNLLKEIFHIFQKVPNLPPARWITWIVDPKYRKTGVGTSLYWQLSSAMFEHGVRCFYGSVETSNFPSNAAHVKFGSHNEGIIMISGRKHYIWRHEAKKHEE